MTREPNGISNKPSSGSAPSALNKIEQPWLNVGISHNPRPVPRVDDLRPLRILVVNWRCLRNPRGGGAEVHLHKIFSLLAGDGHQVLVLCSGWRGGPDEELIDDIRYVRRGSDRLFHLQYKRPMRRLIYKGNFDLVVDDISKIPLGISRHVHLPTIAICHHVHGEMLYYELSRPLAAYVRRTERRLPILYRNTPVLAVSGSTRQELILMGLKSELVGYLHNGVDRDDIKASRQPKSPAPLLVHLGRLQRYKNVDCILKAFTRIRQAVPQARLTIIGTGKHQRHLKALARRICPFGVDFTGRVSEVKKAELLSRAWIALAASVKEGWGISIVEANAAGTPVVASDVPGHRDSVLHNVTGLLYPYDNDAALAGAALRLLRSDSLRQRMSTSAEQWAEQFSWQDSVREFIGAVLWFYPQLAYSCRSESSDNTIVSATFPRNGVSYQM